MRHLLSKSTTTTAPPGIPSLYISHEQSAYPLVLAITVVTHKTPGPHSPEMNHTDGSAGPPVLTGKTHRRQVWKIFNGYRQWFPRRSCTVDRHGGHFSMVAHLTADEGIHGKIQLEILKILNRYQDKKEKQENLSIYLFIIFNSVPIYIGGSKCA